MFFTPFKVTMFESTLSPRGCNGWTPLLYLAAFLVLQASRAADANSPVTVSEKQITLPTYLAGEPDKNPMFFFGRASQHAEGPVYPYPLYDLLTEKKEDRQYQIVYLENEYVRVGILPQLGGRLFEAIDKTNNYHFVYRQHVIKPALIGLIGVWTSGGVEWNIPHHHRATTLLPVQWRIEERGNGSITVWVGELELRHRMRWAVGYTLSPGKSYVKTEVRILNRTSVPNTMLCFTNLAVHANEDYQVVFPPSTQWVTYHKKNEFARWPIATGMFNNADFGSGTDVSWWKNHIAANSLFAWNYDEDFFAGYDHGQNAGTMGVADHHIVPGKKFFTWGRGEFGRMWDMNLTDKDGPYIELMAGAYSDNQPDYSWLQPFETKSVDLYWYPFRDIGGVKSANTDAAVNLEVNEDKTVQLGFYTTSAHSNANVLLIAGDNVLLEENIAINPGKPFVAKVALPNGTEEHDLRASLTDNGEVLISYSPVRLETQSEPPTVVDPPAPEEVETVEELYLIGERINQFHDPLREPEPYWEEACRRDPSNSRVNIALGIRELKRANFDEAERHFRTALERLTNDYTAPKDGEAYYYLGVVLARQGKLDDAFDAFYAATWSKAWQSQAYFSLGEIATRKGDFEEALDYLNRSIIADGLHIRALTLKSALLRLAGRKQEALAVLDDADKIDPLDVRTMVERWLVDGKPTSELLGTLRYHPAAVLEVASEYYNAGLWKDGRDVLQLTVGIGREVVGDDTTENSPLFEKLEISDAALPLAYYYLGDFAERLGNSHQAAEYRTLAKQASPDYVFPFQWEAIHVLRRAMEADPNDARAPYYLGNLLFDWQPENAIALWEHSVSLDPSFPMVRRNLAVAYRHRHADGDLDKAIDHLEHAVSSHPKYAVHFVELDELYAEAGKPLAERLALLTRNHEIVAMRDDSLARKINLLVETGNYDEAISLMTGRRYSVWEEGGSIDVRQLRRQWVKAHLSRGRQKLAAGQPSNALSDFRAAQEVPNNLPYDTDAQGTYDKDLAYWTGRAKDAIEDLKTGGENRE